MGTFQSVNKRLVIIFRNLVAQIRNLGPKPTGRAGVSNSDGMYLALIQRKPASNTNTKDGMKISVTFTIHQSKHTYVKPVFFD